MSPVRIIALVHDDGAAASLTLCSVVALLVARGARLAGVVQRDDPHPGRCRCDMTLEDLTSGAATLISQDRGPEARGCRLAVDALLAAMQGVAAALSAGVDALVLNTFGKSEMEGGGGRDLIVQAVAQGVPVLIAVPARNLEAWRGFAGEMAREVGLNEVLAGVVAEMLMPLPCRSAA